jgi:hypothetical protein
MRIVINLILVAVIAGLVYLLVNSIVEPINFKSVRQKRENAVVDRLIEIRTLQEAYRNIKGEFAGSFNSLNNTLMNDSFRIIQVFGDPDDPTNTDAIIYDTIYRPARDSILKLGINLDSIRYVPYTNQDTFEMLADTITYQQTNVPVVEVRVKYKTFMGEKYGQARFSRYDDSYDPFKYLKFGDMAAPNTSGNWER